MRIELTSVMVQDQEEALDFYTRVLRFVKNRDIPAGARAKTFQIFESHNPAP